MKQIQLKSAEHAEKMREKLEEIFADRLYYRQKFLRGVPFQTSLTKDAPALYAQDFETRWIDSGEETPEALKIELDGLIEADNEVAYLHYNQVAEFLEYNDPKKEKKKMENAFEKAALDRGFNLKNKIKFVWID